MLSGKFATINGIGNVALWSLTETTEVEKIINSATRLGTDRNIGNRDVTGSYTAHGGLPAVFPGDTFNFIGYTSPTNNTKGGAGIRYTVDVLCTQVQIVWDFAAGKVVRHTVQFGNTAPMTIGSGAAILDVTSIKKVNSKSCPFTYGAGTAFLPARTQATLTLTNSGATRSAADTSNYTTREAGVLDWTLAVQVHTQAQEFAPGTYISDLKLGINSTPDSWWFKDAIVESATNITLNTEGTGIETQTINLGMAASNNAGTVGFIRKPGDLVANWWPLA